MTDTAYVVTSGSYSDYAVDSVFLDKRVAEEYVEKRNRLSGRDEYRVEALPLYESPPPLWKQYWVNLALREGAYRPAGSMWHASDVVLEEPAFEAAHDAGYGTLKSSGPDLERCQKSCRDAYARIVAEREGIS